MSPLAYSRRNFLKATGLSASGLILGFSWQPRAKGAAAETGAFQPNAFIVISRETGVTLTIPIPEIGQNTRTALAMILADEMGADLERVNLHQAGPRDDLGSQLAAASVGLRRSYANLRQAAAAAREMLIAGAAAHWKVDPTRCRVDASQVIGPGGRTMPFIEAADYARSQPVPESPPLKPSSDFKYIGKPTRVLDARDIGKGKTLFAVDAMPAGVRFAVMKRCPVLGGTLEGFDGSAAQRMRGVVDILQVGDKVAVIAENTWAAMQASERVQVDWAEGKHAGTSTEALLDQQHVALNSPDQTAFARGDFDPAYAAAPLQLEREFSGPFLCHSPMEPPNCTAWYHDGRVEIWTGCQSLNQLYEALPEYTGLPHDQITCHQLRIGGGFGRKLEHDYIIEALEIAKRVDYPVKLMFTKADDIRHSTYREADRYRYRVGLEKNGYPRALQILNCRRAWSWEEDPFARYFVDAERRFHNVELPLETGSMRGPSANLYSFTQQSMTDVMAEETGIDPLEYRLGLLGDPAAIARLGWPGAPFEDPIMADLIRVVRERSDWKRDPAYGYGVSYFEKNGSRAAVVAIAPKAGGGRPIHRVHVALHCGRIVNPLGARAQMEGGVIDGLSAALYQKIEVREGRVVQRNYEDYPMLKMPEYPEIDVYLAESDEEPRGLGETAYPPTMPAVVSALYDATGRRTTDLPIFG